MDTELGMKDAMSWCCAVLGYHPKSSQDHWQGQTEKNRTFWVFIYSKPIWAAGDY